eukprot:15474180-Alexandrium_andersonii.AAC.1
MCTGQRAIAPVQSGRAATPKVGCLSGPRLRKLARPRPLLLRSGGHGHACACACWGGLPAFCARACGPNRRNAVPAT